MIIHDSIAHLGRLLRCAGPLPGDIRDELGDLEEDVRKLGQVPAVQRRAFRMIRRIEAHLEGRENVVWSVPVDTDPPTSKSSWSSAPPPA